MGLRRFFRRRREDAELTRELESHIAHEIDDNVARGLPEDEARRLAALKFGSTRRVREEIWRQNSFSILENLWRDITYALRQLCKDPSFAITVVVTLALGIGANTAMFTVDYAVFLAPLPYSHPNQLVMIQSKIQGHSDWVSAGDFIDWRQQNTVFQDLNAWSEGGFNIATQDEPENIAATHVTTGFYRMTGDRFYLGRNFLVEEGEAGRDHVVILTHRMWKRLGAKPNIIGTSIRLDGEPYTVVGVLAPGLRDRDAPVIVPLVFKPEHLNHDYHWINVMGRLKPGVTIKQAQADMNTVTAHIAQAYPKSDKGWSVSIKPLKNFSVSNDRKSMLLLLLGAVVFVLLIACVNVANLLLAKGMTRQKEVAIRSALGASRITIFAQSLTESLLLAIVGGVMGIAAGYVMLHGLIAVMPPHTLSSQTDLRMNLPVLIFTFITSGIVGILFGCAPAWYASRVDPGETIKEGGRAGIGLGSHRLRRMLIVSEFALTLSLLAGAGLAVHSFWNLVRVDLGLRTDHLLTFVLGVPDSRSKAPERIVAYYHQILTSIQAVPGVSDATVMSGMPLQVSGFSMPFTIAGKSADPSIHLGASVQQVTPDYFRTFGIQLVKGRVFTEQDNASSVKVAIVNEDFVRHFLKGLDPLQQRLVIQQFIPGVAKLGPPVEWQIVGVSHTVRSFGPREDDTEIDIPFWQTPWDSASLGVRTAEDPASMIKSIAAAVHAVDPQIGIAEPRTMDQIRDEVLANDRFTMILLICFAAIALLLVSVGIYGVMAFSLAQRSHEIAVRMALGANRSRMIVLVLKEGLVLVSIGLGFGLIGAYFVGHAMQHILFGVGAMDFTAFSAVGLILMLAAMLACYLPALRAASIDPMQALRAE